MNEVSKGIVVLVAILGITGGICVYEIFSKNILKEGDFAEIYYIAYFENGTVFSSSFKENVSYSTPFNAKKYNLTASKIYFGKGYPERLPDKWSYADLGKIEGKRIYEIKGLYEEMRGMKKGEEKTIEIEPSKAFGKRIKEGIIFNTSAIFGFDADFEIISVGKTTVDLKWLPKENEVFTMPHYWYSLPVHQPYWLWENATQVISFNDTHVVLKTTPNKLNNLTLYPWFVEWEGRSNASYNETKIWITTTPPLGNFTISTPYGSLKGEVLNVTKDKIKVRYFVGNESVDVELNRTEIFNRSIAMPLIFKEISKIYIEEDLERLGYSFHELAGKKVIFRIKLLKIYRLS